MLLRANSRKFWVAPRISWLIVCFTYIFKWLTLCVTKLTVTVMVFIMYIEGVTSYVFD